MNQERVLKVVSLIALALVLMLSYWRLFIGEAFFWGLPALQFVPWRAYGFDMIRAGHLPLWNPYNGAGAPLFANYQSAFLYPLNWFGILAPNYAALGWLMSLTAVVHLFIGGWGMWCFTGRRGAPAVGRGVSAIAFALTSYVVGRLGTYPIISVTAWIPFLLWAAVGVIELGRRRDAAWLALFVGLALTAGHAQTAWYALLLTGLYSLWLAYGRPHPKSLPAAREGLVIRSKRLLIALAAVILGAVVAGMQLMATADLLANSQRSSGYGEETAAFNFSYAPLRIPNMIAPNVYGNPGDGSYLARGVFYEEAVYIGLVPLVAAFSAIFAAIGRLFRKSESDDAQIAQFKGRADIPFWAVILLIGFVFAMGRHTPIFPFLYRNIPTFDMFQAPGRWHIWTVTALSVLASVGASNWGQGKWVIFWTRLVTAGAVGALILAQLSPQFLPPETLAIEGVQVLIREVSMTAVWVILAGLLTLLYAPNVPEWFAPLPRWWQPAWTVLVIVVVAADLGWATRGLNPTVPAVFYNPLPDVESDPMHRGYWTQEALNLVLYGQQEGEDGALEFVEADELGFDPWLDGQDYRIAQENWQTFRRTNLPNLNLLDRTYLLNNFDPLLLATFADLIDSLPEDETEQINVLQQYGVDALYTATDVLAATEPTERVELLVDGEISDVQDEFGVMQISFDEITSGNDENLIVRDICAYGWVAYSDSAFGIPVNCTENPSYFRLTYAPDSQDLFMVYRPWWVIPSAITSIFGVVILMALFILPPRP